MLPLLPADGCDGEGDVLRARRGMRAGGGSEVRARCRYRRSLFQDVRGGIARGRRSEKYRRAGRVYVLKRGSSGRVRARARLRCDQTEGRGVPAEAFVHRRCV